MAEKGKLIGIGVGPGDTELLTLKAARILESVPVIFSPKSSKEKESIALSIVKPVIEKRKDYKRLMLVEPIFPMIEDKDELEKDLQEFHNEYSKYNFLEEVIESIKNDDSKKVILYSPAAQSYDQYDNFEQRGEHFNSLVNKYWHN